jgi:hypothetical protein
VGKAVGRYAGAPPPPPLRPAATPIGLPSPRFRSRCPPPSRLLPRPRPLPPTCPSLCAAGGDGDGDGDVGNGTATVAVAGGSDSGERCWRSGGATSSAKRTQSRVAAASASCVVACARPGWQQMAPFFRVSFVCGISAYAVVMPSRWRCGTCVCFVRASVWQKSGLRGYPPPTIITDTVVRD